MTTLTLAALFAFATPASAYTSSAEAHENSTEVTQNRRDLADDLDDLARLDSLVDQWEAGRARGSRALLEQADRQLAAWIEQELSESRRDVALARSEVDRSERELREEKRDERGPYAKTGREVAEERDDARDLADDRADLAAREQDLARTERLAAELASMQDRFDRNRASASDFARKSQLLRQLRDLALTDIARDRAELAEDEAERREDRRDR